jgi:predicted RecA/RadA family phage recombinase
MATVKQATIKNTRQLDETNKASGTVTTLGEILELASGLAIAATSGATRATILGVCNQTIAVADALTRVQYIVPSDEDTFIFSTTNNSDATHNGQDMIIGANSTTINNTGNTSAVGVVRQVEPYGATGDKLIIGKFITV